MSNEEDFWIDDCFRVYRQRWGTWISFDKEGKELVTSLTKESCISGTRFYLKGKMEGFPDPISTHEGYVGGKL